MKCLGEIIMSLSSIYILKLTYNLGNEVLMGNDMGNCVQLCPSSQLQEPTKARSNSLYGGAKDVDGHREYADGYDGTSRVAMKRWNHDS